MRKLRQRVYETYLRSQSQNMSPGPPRTSLRPRASFLGRGCEKKFQLCPSPVLPPGALTTSDRCGNAQFLRSVIQPVLLLTEDILFSTTGRTGRRQLSPAQHVHTHISSHARHTPNRYTLTHGHTTHDQTIPPRHTYSINIHALKQENTHTGTHAPLHTRCPPIHKPGNNFPGPQT